MDKLNLKFFTVRILELDSACYGGCLLFDTSNVRTAHQGRRVPELLQVKKVLFPGHNHLLTTGADNPTL